MERKLAYKTNNLFCLSFDLTLSQWKVMAYLEKFGTSTLVGISNYLAIEKPSVTRTIARLEDKQLVERVLGQDKREKRVQLTGSGKTLFRECQNTLDGIEFQLLNGISAEEQSILLQLLIKIQGNL